MGKIPESVAAYVIPVHESCWIKDLFISTLDISIVVTPTTGDVAADQRMYNIEDCAASSHRHTFIVDKLHATTGV